MSIPQQRSPFSKISLQAAIVLPFVSLIVGAVGLVGYLSYRSGQESVDKLASRLQNEINIRVAEKITTYLQTIDQINKNNISALRRGTWSFDDFSSQERQAWEQMQLSSLSPMTIIGFGTPTGGHRAVERLNDGKFVIRAVQNGGGSYMSFTPNPDGSPNQGTQTAINFDSRQRPWYQVAENAKKAAWTHVYPHIYTGELLIALAEPVYELKEGKFLGVTYGIRALDEISHFLQTIDIRSGAIFIMERDGTLVATSGSQKPYQLSQNVKTQQLLKAIDSPSLSISMTAKYLRDRFGDFTNINQSTQFDIDMNGDRQFVQAVPITSQNGLDWMIVVVIPESDFTAEIQANRVWTFLLCGLTLFLAIGVSLFITRWIARPILRLSLASKAIARRDWQEVLLEDSAIAEVKMLTESFQQMSIELQALDLLRSHYEHDLERMVATKTAVLTEVQRIAHVGSWELDVESGVITWSYEQSRILGFQPSLPIPSYTDFFDMIPLADRPKLQEAVESAIALGTTYKMEHGIIRPDGSICYVISRGVAVSDEQGEVIKLIGTIIDISDRKQAQKTLELQSIIMNNMAEGVCLVKVSNLIIVYTNPKFDDMFGYLEGELVGQHVGILNCVDTNVTPDVTVLDIVTQLYRYGEAQYEVYNRKKDDTLFWCRVQTSTFEHPEYGTVYVAVQQDITKLKQAEIALQQSETQLRNLFAGMTDYIFVLNSEGRYLEVAPTQANIESNCISKLDRTLHEHLPTTTADYFLETIQQVIETQKSCKIEYQLELEGKTLWFSTIVSPLERESVLWVARNISDRKQLEINLQLSESKLYDILNSATAAITRLQIEVDGTWKISYVSKGVEAISGYSPAELIADQDLWINRIYPEDWQIVEKEVFANIFAQRSGTYIYRFQHKDGSQRWISQTNHSRWDENQNVYVVTIISTDISDRKQAEIELERLSQRLALSLKSGNIGYWDWDINQNNIFWDDQMYELYGVTKQSNSRLVYDIWANGIHPDDRNDTETLLQQAILGGAEYQTEFRVIHPDHTIRFVQAYGTVLRDTKGIPKSIIGINFDITDRKQAELSIKQSEEKYRHLIDNLHSGIVVHAADTRASLKKSKRGKHENQEQLIT